MIGKFSVERGVKQKMLKMYRSHNSTMTSPARHHVMLKMQDRVRHE